MSQPSSMFVAGDVIQTILRTFFLGHPVQGSCLRQCKIVRQLLVVFKSSDAKKSLFYSFSIGPIFGHCVFQNSVKQWPIFCNLHFKFSSWRSALKCFSYLETKDSTSLSTDILTAAAQRTCTFNTLETFENSHCRSFQKIEKYLISMMTFTPFVFCAQYFLFDKQQQRYRAHNFRL